MNDQRLIENVIEQIKEAQLKLGFEKEVIRLYFPVTSMNAILGTKIEEAQQMLQMLRENESFNDTVLGRIKFFRHEDRIEVRVAPEGAEYVSKLPDPAFLKSVIALFGTHHHLTIEEICDCFAASGRAYICEQMEPGTDFDYVVYFEDADFDEYYYCIKMEMGHTIYHRFTKEDYELL